MNKMIVKDFFVAWAIWYGCIVGAGCILAFCFYGVGVLTRQDLRKRVIHWLLISMILSFINSIITIIIYRTKWFGLGLALSVLTRRIIFQTVDFLIDKIQKL